MKDKIRIAICGTRGVPANYGGFETFAEELGARLVKAGHEVLVYCRHYDSPHQRSYNHRGMECISLRAIKHKYLETPLHTLLSFLHKSINRCDIILLCNAANSPFAFIPRLKGKPVIINVDGIERERRKWNWLGKAWYYFGEFCSVLFGSKLVSDANYIHDYYLKKYKRGSSVIRYGAKHLSTEDAELKARGDFSFLNDKRLQFYASHNIIPGQYILYVSRLEPENNADKVILAYNQLEPQMRVQYPLLIVGDAPYSTEFKTYIKDLASSEVRFLGYQFGEAYVDLQAGAYIYVQATEVGGTHPALLEAMGFSNAILANLVPEHVEVVESCALLYKYNDYNDLSRLLKELIEEKQQVFSLRKLAFQKAISEYSWDAICEQYVELFNSQIKR